MDYDLYLDLLPLLTISEASFCLELTEWVSGRWAPSNAASNTYIDFIFIESRRPDDACLQLTGAERLSSDSDKRQNI